MALHLSYGQFVRGGTLNVIQSHSARRARIFGQLPQNYFIGNDIDTHVSCVWDLSVLLDSRLSFNAHLEFLIAKTSKLIGFIKRTTYSFTDITPRFFVFFVISIGIGLFQTMPR